MILKLIFVFGLTFYIFNFNRQIIFAKTEDEVKLELNTDNLLFDSSKSIDNDWLYQSGMLKTTRTGNTSSIIINNVKGFKYDEISLYIKLSEKVQLKNNTGDTFIQRADILHEIKIFKNEKVSVTIKSNRQIEFYIKVRIGNDIKISKQYFLNNRTIQKETVSELQTNFTVNLICFILGATISIVFFCNLDKNNSNTSDNTKLD